MCAKPRSSLRPEGSWTPWPFAGEHDSELVPDGVGDGHGPDGFGERPLRDFQLPCRNGTGDGGSIVVQSLKVPPAGSS